MSQDKPPRPFVAPVPKSRWHPLFSLRGARLRRDVLAGLALAAVALPEQLATARLAGVPATQGLVVFAVASLIMVLIARDRTLSVGADSTVAPLVAAAILASQSAPGVAPLLALMVGAVLTAIAVLRLDWVAALLSRTVATGMMAGIALHILVGRLPSVLGLDLPAASPVTTLTEVARYMPQARLAPFLIAAGMAALCVAGWRRWPRLPLPLVALAIATGVAALLDPGANAIPRIDAASGGLGLSSPAFDPALIVPLIPDALSIAFLCLSQSIIVLQSDGEVRASNRRNAIGAVGLANLAVGATGGFPVNSSPPRTQLLRDNRATSQLAGLIASLIGLALIAFGSGLLAHIPSAALAGLLIFIALHLFPAARLADLIRRSRAEGAIALATAALVTGLPLQAGLPLAIALSLAHASLPVFQSQVVAMRQVPGTTVWWRASLGELAEGPLVLGLSSSLNFANAGSVVHDIRAHLRGQPPDLLVLECAGVLSVDLTAADMLATLLAELRGKGIRVALARLESERAETDLRRSGFLDQLGAENLFLTVDQAMAASDPLRPLDSHNAATSYPG